MGCVLKAKGATDIFLVGDNFYQDGVASADSTRFNGTFENVYIRDIFGDDMCTS